MDRRVYLAALKDLLDNQPDFSIFEDLTGFELHLDLIQKRLTSEAVPGGVFIGFYISLQEEEILEDLREEVSLQERFLARGYN